MTTTTLEIDIPPEEPLIVVRRHIAAPPALVFQAWTDPEQLRRWWGPRSMELAVCELDLRVGGAWHFVHRAPDGQEYGFHGEYREIEPPHRLVSTFVYEGAPDHEALDMGTFEQDAGGTLFTGTTRHDSIAARDAHVAAGMERGMTESHERLDELLASPRVS